MFNLFDNCKNEKYKLFDCFHLPPEAGLALINNTITLNIITLFSKVMLFSSTGMLLFRTEKTSNRLPSVSDMICLVEIAERQ